MSEVCDNLKTKYPEFYDKGVTEQIDSNLQRGRGLTSEEGSIGELTKNFEDITLASQCLVRDYANNSDTLSEENWRSEIKAFASGCSKVIASIISWAQSLWINTIKVLEYLQLYVKGNNIDTVTVSHNVNSNYAKSITLKKNGDVRLNNVDSINWNGMPTTFAQMSSQVHMNISDEYTYDPNPTAQYKVKTTGYYLITAKLGCSPDISAPVYNVEMEISRNKKTNVVTVSNPSNSTMFDRMDSISLIGYLKKNDTVYIGARDPNSTTSTAVKLNANCKFWLIQRSDIL